MTNYIKFVDFISKLNGLFILKFLKFVYNNNNNNCSSLFIFTDITQLKPDRYNKKIYIKYNNFLSSD